MYLRLQPRQCEIYKNGKLIIIPRDAIKNGFVLVTEERRATGIFPIVDIRFNTVILICATIKLGLIVRFHGCDTQRMIDAIWKRRTKRTTFAA